MLARERAEHELRHGHVRRRIDAVTGHVVLDAHKQMSTPMVEDSARPFGSQIVQRRNPDASIGQLVGIVSIVHA